MLAFGTQVRGFTPGRSRRIFGAVDKGRLPHVYINQRLQIQFRAPDDERCAAGNMLSLQ